MVMDFPTAMRIVEGLMTDETGSFTRDFFENLVGHAPTREAYDEAAGFIMKMLEDMRGRHERQAAKAFFGLSRRVNRNNADRAQRAWLRGERCLKAAAERKWGPPETVAAPPLHGMNAALKAIAHEHLTGERLPQGSGDPFTMLGMEMMIKLIAAEVLADGVFASELQLLSPKGASVVAHCAAMLEIAGIWENSELKAMAADFVSRQPAVMQEQVMKLARQICTRRAAALAAEH
jgi:hypothetical protein